MSNPGGIVIYNINNTRNIIFVQSIVLSGSQLQCVCTDRTSYVYACGANRMLYCIDVQVAANASVVGSVLLTADTNTTSINQCSYAAYNGYKLVFAGANYNGMIIANVLTPTAPTIMYTQGTGFLCVGMTETIYDFPNLAYYVYSVLNNSNPLGDIYLQITRVTNPNAPVHTTLIIWTGDVATSCQMFARNIYVSISKPYEISQYVVINLFFPGTPSIRTINTATVEYDAFSQYGKTFYVQNNVIYILGNVDYGTDLRVNVYVDYAAQLGETSNTHLAAIRYRANSNLKYSKCIAGINNQLYLLYNDNTSYIMCIMTIPAAQYSGTFNCSLNTSTLSTITTARVISTAGSSDPLSGALIVTGGTGIQKDLFVGDTINASDCIFANSTMNATNISSGSLVVKGGTGIAGNLHVGGNTNTNTLTLNNTVNNISQDGTMASQSDSNLSTEKAIVSYIASNNNSMWTAIGNPPMPLSTLDTVNMTFQTNPYDACFFTDGNNTPYCAVCMYDTGGIAIFNINNTQNIILVGSVAIPGSQLQCICTNGTTHVYTCGANRMLYCVDVQTPTTPTVVGSVLLTADTNTTLISQCVYGSYNGYTVVVASSNYNGLLIASVVTPSTPTVLYTQGTDIICVGVTDLEIQTFNVFAYSLIQNSNPVGNAYIQTADIISPTAPIYYTKIVGLGSTLTSIQKINSLLYVTVNSSPSYINIYQLGFTSPTLRTSTTINANPIFSTTGKSLVEHGHTLYVLKNTDNGGLNIYQHIDAYHINASSNVSEFNGVFFGGNTLGLFTRCLVARGNQLYFMANRSPSFLQSIQMVPDRWYSDTMRCSAMICDSVGSNTLLVDDIQINDTATATNTASGALIVAGGASMGGTVYVGGDLHITGDLIITGTLSCVIRVLVFVTNTAYVPSASLGSCMVEIVGGGGGGGAANSGGQCAGGGGGSGAYAKSIYNASVFSGSVSVIVGTGGSAGVVGGVSGGNGTVTSFGTLMSVNGGIGGTNGVPNGSNWTYANGGAGGTVATLGNLISLTGQSGTQGVSMFQTTPGTNVIMNGGTGGSTLLGIGGVLQYGSLSLATGYGSGGSGGCVVSGGAVGLAGRIGVCIITEFR
jgi:hypothetical protein